MFVFQFIEMLTPERVNNCVLLTLKVLITTLITPGSVNIF